MRKAPYSLIEAENICSEFQYLTGQPFAKDLNIFIDCVVISPFDQNSKNKFIIYYLLCDDNKFALKHDYKGLLFDVIVISCFQNDQQFLHEDIHTWLTKNKGLANLNMDLTEGSVREIKNSIT